MSEKHLDTFTTELLLYSESSTLCEAIDEWEATEQMFTSETTRANGDLFCICGKKLVYQYEIKNNRNGYILPRDHYDDKAIGCICLKKFMPKIYKEIVKQTCLNCGEVHRRHKKYKTSRKYYFCKNCESDKKIRLKKELKLRLKTDDFTSKIRLTVLDNWNPKL